MYYTDNVDIAASVVARLLTLKLWAYIHGAIILMVNTSRNAITVSAHGNVYM